MFEIRTYGGDVRMAEAEISFNGKVIGYVGASAHESTVREIAEQRIEEALNLVFAPALEYLEGNYDVKRYSRFMTYDDETCTFDCTRNGGPHDCMCGN